MSSVCHGSSYITQESIGGGEKFGALQQKTSFPRIKPKIILLKNIVLRMHHQISTITLQQLCQVGGKEHIFLFLVSLTPSLVPLNGIQTSRFPNNIKHILMFSTKSKLMYFQSISRTIVPLISNQEKSHHCRAFRAGSLRRNRWGYGLGGGEF